ncbi:hypothetical protein V3481_006689 [Fusarium oxysporum f. sp. vasinfectum]
MRLPISVFLSALWAASYVVGKGPSGLKPGPRRCDRYCAPGVSCPANDGCFIQGRANMSAEAEERCSSTVESVVAAEQTSCAASISAEQTNCISAQQSSCAASISAEQTSCAASISAEQTSCAASISAEQTSCASSISAEQTSCAASISAEQTSCAASISAEQTNCISAQQSSCAASISLAIASDSSSVSSAQQTSCAASIQAAVASAAVGQKCGLVGGGRDPYQTLDGVDFPGCKARCLADFRCLSYSPQVAPTHQTTWGVCLLYEKRAKDLVLNNSSAFPIFDRNCP